MDDKHAALFFIRVADLHKYISCETVTGENKKEKINLTRWVYSWH